MKVIGYTEVPNKNSKFSSYKEQISAIEKHCDGEGFQLDEIFHGGQKSEEEILTSQLFDMLSYMLLREIDTIVVENWNVIIENENVRESLVVFLASKGLKVRVCEGVEDEAAIILQKQGNQLRVRTQKIFTRFDQNTASYKRIYARQQIRMAKGKCEGRKSYKEVAPDIVKEIRRLRRKRLGRKRRTFAEIANILNNTGYVTLSGRKFTGNNVSVIHHRLRAS